MPSKEDYYISSNTTLASQEDAQFFRNDQLLKNHESTTDISLRSLKL